MAGKLEKGWKMQNNPFFPREENPFKPFMSYSGVFHCLLTGENKESQLMEHAV